MVEPLSSIRLKFEILNFYILSNIHCHHVERETPHGGTEYLILVTINLIVVKPVAAHFMSYRRRGKMRHQDWRQQSESKKRHRASNLNEPMWMYANNPECV